MKRGPMKRDAMNLKFATITCDRCSGTRLMGQPCPECGRRAEPHEVQPDLDRRRAAVAAFRSGRRPAEPADVSADQARQGFGRSIDAVLRELARTAKGGRDAAG